MALVQSAGTTGASVPSFGSATTAGNLLVAVSVSAGATTFNQPTGFASRSGFSATAFAGECWTKIADGSETSVDGVVTSGNGNYIIAEFDDAVAGGFDAVAQDHTNLATAVTSQSSGTATASGSGFALAIYWGDGLTTLDGSPTYSNSFTQAVASTTSSARGGIWIATKTVSAGSVESTRGCTDTGDEMAGAMIIFLASGGGGGPTYTLTAGQGSYSLTGQSASLLASRTISASSGSYALAGQAAGLRAGRLLTAAQGAYSLTGYDADLVYTPISGATYTLTASRGLFALTGIAAGLRASRTISAAAGSYTLSGQSAGLYVGRRLSAAAGSYTLTGVAAVLKVARRILAETGAYTLTGRAATLTYSGGSNTPPRRQGRTVIGKVDRSTNVLHSTRRTIVFSRRR